MSEKVVPLRVHTCTLGGTSSAGEQACDELRRGRGCCSESQPVDTLLAHRRGTHARAKAAALEQPGPLDQWTAACVQTPPLGSCTPMELL